MLNLDYSKQKNSEMTMISSRSSHNKALNSFALLFGTQQKMRRTLTRSLELIMSYRISLPIFAAILITGCAITPKFSGNSLTDQLLRHDVSQSVLMLFRAHNACDIEAINSQVIETITTQPGHITGANELWVVTGCNKEESYNVQLRSDAQGETDYSISKIN